MPSDDVRIRRARLADASEMSRLAGELGYPMSLGEMQRRMTRLSENPHHCVFVAESDGNRLLGWMHIEYRLSLEGGERGEVMGLVVDTTARRQGIGRALMKVAEEWAALSGVRELTVRSNLARELSHPFYLALGYAIAKTQRVYTKAIAPRNVGNQ